MAFSKDQSEPVLPAGANPKRTSVDFLPRYFRTSTNKKFLNATVDQMISEGQVDKINAFIGRKTARAYTTADRYLDDISTERSAYQLEPAVVIKDSLDNVTFFKDYNDYINQLKFFNTASTDHSKINSQEYYAWNPHINWDMFVNYREYYWLPNGPQSIAISGQSTDIISTYSVDLVDDVDNVAYVFTPNGLTRNPSIKLYRGQTYKFDINCKDHPIAFKTQRTAEDAYFFIDGVTATSAYTEVGTIEFTVPLTAPDVIYYVSKNDINSSGFFKVYDIIDSTAIDVDNEIVGKKNYRLAGDIELSNGMQVYFQGQVTPAKYATGNWYVEGVGSKITLVSASELEAPAPFTSAQAVEFDTDKFDTQGFDVNANFLTSKDYIVINRSSKDRNPWARYNRWFHRSVVETSALANNQPVDIDQTARATRPIIEFEAGIELWNFGVEAKKNVTLVDTYTQDVFSTIEGSIGYNIDGIDLIDGMRILFTADTDVTVSGRIYKVGFITHLGQKRITLIAEDDSDPIEGETVLVTTGNFYQGAMFYFADGLWYQAQSKTAVNQSPLFDVFDESGISYGDRLAYTGSSFVGTQLFSYATGTSYDAELNRNIKYQNVGNIGDIVFDFNLHTDSFSYQDIGTIITNTLDRGYVKVNNGLQSSSYQNGWMTAATNSSQPVIRQYDATTQFNFFEIDTYARSGDLTDLSVTVFINGTKQGLLDFDIFRQNGIAYVQLFKDAALNDVVIIETTSAAPKNDNGFYKFPANLENNPNNLSLTSLTLGQINNHVSSITDTLPSFIGKFPGTSNLRDLAGISAYGTQVVQHSSPLAPVIYHFTNKDFNIVKSLRYAQDEYSKFKRNLIRVATSYGYTGLIRNHLDIILQECNKDKTKDVPFYLSDMLPYGANVVYSQEVIDNSFTDYPLVFDFDLTTASNKAVMVYVNDVLLTHGSDYVFINTSFIRVLSAITAGDQLKVIQYESTTGCCVPPTPTKLGLYPAFEPKIYIDNTYQTPTKVIQGHDGSITAAFSKAGEANEYRDELLLEFETRIFNNLKVQYNASVFDINKFISGQFRIGDVSSDELNNTMRQEFLRWSTLISDDYTKHTFFDRTNTFTYNYKNFATLDGSMLPGFWRGIFKQVYDTDRPHTNPWEMLGYSIEPAWWQSVYGPAPYTRDNLILWQDLSEGLIREPGKLVVRNAQYARPDLLSIIPTSSSGTLLDPLSIGLVKDFNPTLTEYEFTFGDQAPIETAWRRSSNYAFALITTLAILRPAKVFATCFDRIRQYRDNTGQLVYKLDNGNLRFNLQNIVYPNTVNDTTSTFTSGLVNYVIDYATSRSATYTAAYKSDLELMQVKLSSKLAGFTTKEKFKLILDSRSPLNNGNVFIPEENYDIILNTSSPVLSINYSGVIVEKQSSGFIIKGYNLTTPEFKYYAPMEIVSDPVINVGGISEAFITWTANKYYSKGQIVKTDTAYYRVTTPHSSSGVFETKYYAKLPVLPTVGGRSVTLRRQFDTELQTLHYGAELKTVQAVVDFLLGYGKYLTSMGFEFESYNPTLQTVTDWQTTAKEFAFWTTQNWSAGSVITLSPAADELVFKKAYAVVDNIYDSFYSYSVFKQDGVYLDQSYTNKVREDNSFSLSPQNTSDGIYHATLNLVQKEHVLILDDKTVFNDIIYDQTQGYRQDRIKVVGYRMSNWNGDFNIPGFIYDRALVTQWESWKDYALGETVKFKEFYYSAKQNVPGSESFDASSWFKLAGRPSAGLLPNWDYRANQFADFYDLDTDSFDVSQQAFSQHLIGYQKRQYLENIINDDVSQYKFYQGMIQEKGTKNSLSKLFDALNSAEKESLEFYEEWAIRLGQYGATAGFDEVEYIIDEAKMLINPQPFELVESIDKTLNDFVYRITPDNVYVQPDDYTHAPFPTGSVDEYLATAGYTHLEDVKYSIVKKSELSSIDIKTLVEGDYVWVGFDTPTWNVYRFTLFATSVDAFEKVGTNLRITFNTARTLDLAVGAYIGINNTNLALESIHKIVAVGLNYIEIVLPTVVDNAAVLALNTALNVDLFKFTSQRISTIDDLNSLPLTRKRPGELVWVDGVDGNWAVWQFTKTYTSSEVQIQEALFGRSLTVSSDNKLMAVGATNRVLYFSRPTANFTWVFSDTIAPATTVDYTDTYGSFGEFVSMDATGNNLFISAPTAGSIVTPGAQPTDPDIVTQASYGYVAQYTKDLNGSYIFARIIQAPVQTVNEQFGTQTVVVGNNLYVVANGTSKIYVYNLATETLSASLSLAVGDVITEISVTSSNKLAIGIHNIADELVKVYQYASATFTLLQTITVTEPLGSKFAQSVAFTSDGSLLAIGIPKLKDTNDDQGAVSLYSLVDAGYAPSAVILSPVPYDSEKFGYSVRFNAEADRLVVYSYGGNQTIDCVFDESSTTFDLAATRILDTEEFVGSVKVYEKYANTFLFADELERNGAIGINYGSPLFVTDRIYVSDSTVSMGAIYDYTSEDKSWAIYRQPEPSIDLNKIKSVFLYNTKTNSIITMLDYIDPIQGKILGIAEQELSFKTYFDPATYSIGIEDVVVDPLMSWKDQSVGKLWWDLSTVKFMDPYQGSAIYKANSWNSVYADASVDIYEWVESEYSPSTWDELADTEAGLTLGVSGLSKHGDLAYSLKQTFDTVSQTFKNVYYFWVKNKKTTPEIDGRKISANEVSGLISDPKSKNIKYVALLGANQFALINCKDLVSGTDVAINFRYWVIDNTEINIHSHYQLLADGDPFKKLNKYVEQKWFDSLVGYDINGADVPDIRLPAKLKYGILNKPRQSMFINRLEALKQFIERVNSVLIANSIVDDFDLTNLSARDEPPSALTGKYDIEIATASEIRFVGSSGFLQAAVAPVVESGKITKVLVTSAGRGYKIAPEVQVLGAGTGAVLQSIINARGEVTGVEVLNPGRDYLDSTSLSIRPFTILVTADETASSKWSLYSWDVNSEGWFRSKTQVYDVTKHWSYVDWYAAGYGVFTKISHIVDFAYELDFLEINLGDIVKINNEKSGGWLLLEKIDVANTTNTTVNYKTIGRENGTIQFNSNLYKFSGSSIGYDGITFDSDVYDDEPKEELRIIVECIKNDLFIDNFAIEYNKLFFASLRYALSEQPFIDWAFKTSFVKSRHNLGTLDQRVTYQNDNLASYEDYINEVKPYRTKVREFVSTYDTIDKTRSAVTDFDLPARYSADDGKIIPFSVSVVNAAIDYNDSAILTEPYSNWYANAGYQITSIKIVDSGSGYQAAPSVEILGLATEAATATAYVSQGRVSKIVINNPGSGYLTTPTIVLNGAVSEGGSIARVAVILGNGNVRSIKTAVKFDRISAQYQISSLAVTQQFSGTGSKTKFLLRWPIDIKTNKTTVTSAGEELLSSDFTVYNVLDTTASYTRYNGYLEFTNAPSSTATIVIAYNKDISLLDAADRIQHYYTSGTGKLGKDLGQLMQGVDYGGVEVTGIKFEIGSGWDALPWFTSGWDDFDETYSDHLIASDGTTRQFYLPYVPADGELINTYINGVRVDDVYYDVYSSAVSILSARNAELLVLQSALSAAVIQSANDQQIFENVLTELSAQQEILDPRLSSTASKLVEYENAELLNPGDPANAILYTQYLALKALSDAQQLVVDGLEDELTLATVVKNASAAAVITDTLLVNAKLPQVAAAQLVYDNLLAAGNVITNTNAVINTFTGNGVDAGPLTIPNDFALAFNDVIIFRKSTSDGSFKPNPKFYDSEILGGDFTYTTARGILAEEINIDGDGFVTTTSSHAPEEVVPGQVVDTVDITVYNKVSDGVPVVVTKHYIADGLTDRFEIGQSINSDRAVFVKINGQIVEQDIAYTVEFIDQAITMTDTPANKSEIVVTSISRNGINVLDSDFFIGDGTTTEFISVARWAGEYTVVVTINGQDSTVTSFIADSSYTDLVNNIGFRFATAPQAGELINYTILNGIVDTLSKVDSETIVHDGVSNIYTLTKLPKYKQPYENNIIVQYDGKVLRPSDTVYFDVTGSVRTYTVSPTDYAVNSIDPISINVYLNGAPLAISKDYTWVSSSNQLKIKRGVASTGDQISLVILRNAQYEILGTTPDLQIRLFDEYAANDRIVVTTFTNHDILEIERNNDFFESKTQVAPGSIEYYSFNQIIAGRIALRSPSLGAQYVWLSLNNELLTPEIDYILEENKQFIRIDPKRQLTTADSVDIIVFSSNITASPFAYKIFKDSLNRTFYKRIDDSSTTVLTAELKYYDTVIEVANAAGLPAPLRSQNRPGIIMVNGERIEYFVKDGNILSQLRRGTLGTGVPVTHAVSSTVRDQGTSQTIPYKDEVVDAVIIADGILRDVPVEFTPMVNTASVAVGNTWYRSTIPANYGQCDEIEVFVAGRRLRKNPTTMWSITEGPDSPVGDITVEAEFSVNGLTGSVRLTEVPANGVQVRIQKRVGKVWAPLGSSLVNSQSDQAKFIRSTPALLPGTTIDKYDIGN